MGKLAVKCICPLKSHWLWSFLTFRGLSILEYITEGSTAYCSETRSHLYNRTDIKELYDQMSIKFEIEKLFF